MNHVYFNIRNRSYFRSTSDSDIAGNLDGWLYDAYYNAAMADYPVAANFVQPLPAFLVKQVIAVAFPVKPPSMPSSTNRVNHNYGKFLHEGLRVDDCPTQMACNRESITERVE